MVSDFFINLVVGMIANAPVLALPAGFSAGISFLTSVVGYINVWLPLARLAPILALVVLVRNWNIVIAILKFILQFIPFIG